MNRGGRTVCRYERFKLNIGEMDDPDNCPATHIEVVPVANNSVDDATAELIWQLSTLPLATYVRAAAQPERFGGGSVLAPQLQQVKLNVFEGAII